MKEPDIPANEAFRQLAVERYQLLDTLSEDNFDDITSLISQICDAPISLITLLDKERNFLKSHHGVPFSESPRNLSFCGHAINSERDIMIVENAGEDERFEGNPLVTEQGAKFYAGVPLVSPDGYKLGTLCVFDVKPRQLTPLQETALITISKQVMRLFEERMLNRSLLDAQEELQSRNESLRNFAKLVSHDLKSPLNSIKGLIQLLELSNGDKLDDESKEYIQMMRKSSDSLRGYIDGLLEYYASDELAKMQKEDLRVSELIAEVASMCGPNGTSAIAYDGRLDGIQTNKAALTQVLVNLITNGLKYNHKEQPKINISATEDGLYYHFKVQDNGDGIPSEYLENIFEVFFTLGAIDRSGDKGSGIGLASVQKLVKSMNGEISAESKLGEGSVFSFSIGKFG